jgi:hypothetical protein
MTSLHLCFSAVLVEGFNLSWDLSGRISVQRASKGVSAPTRLIFFYPGNIDFLISSG